MSDSITIPQSSSFPEYLDFARLRELGIRHIEALGSELWTDYNLHDPGITILEVLCYALTDLGYRTNFDIKDLLTRTAEEKKARGVNFSGRPCDDNFFTAAEILSCNPVSITDFRKLLIDIPGVKNAWLEPADGAGAAIELDEKTQSLRFVPEGQEADSCEVKIKGLYDICIETEPFLKADACGRSFFTEEDIIKSVYEVFHRHRNLCEDLRDVIVYGEEEIAVCADIEMKPNADPEAVLLAVYQKVEEFLSPSLRFYTLQEMLAKGKPVEEIFAGRPMRVSGPNSGEEPVACSSAQTAQLYSHGFIDVEELEKMNPRSRVYASDIFHEIMSVEGVLAIHRLSLANYINGLPQTTGEKWCVKLTPRHRQHLSLDFSRINFFKGPLPFNVDEAAVKQRFVEEKVASTKVLLDPYYLDLPVPEGVYRNPADYLSIHHEFPLTYGVGPEGLPRVPTPERVARARQLQAYLLFFDQLLANYLSQLAHVRDLFSMAQDKGYRGEENRNRTYFTQELGNAPAANEVIRNFVSCELGLQEGEIPEDYSNYLKYITERPSQYNERRNRFLDHLLARFSESFSDYGLLMYRASKKRTDQQGIIQDKADFLQSYPEISRNRGKGFDITPAQYWDTNNVAGLKKRVSRLLGIDDYRRRTLGIGSIEEAPAGMRIVVRSTTGQAVMRSTAVFQSEGQAQEAWQAILERLGDARSYHCLNFQMSDAVEYGFYVVDGEGKKIAESVSRYPGLNALKENINQVQNLIGEATAGDFVDANDGQGDYFELFGPDGEVLLRSIIADPDTLQELKQELISIGKDGRHYCREEYPVAFQSKYGFGLLDGSCNLLAESVQRWEEEGDCEQDLYSFLSQVRFRLSEAAETGIEREEECFSLGLLDAGGVQVLLESAMRFKNKKEAEEAYFNTEENSGLLPLAGDQANYADKEENGRFSFDLETEGEMVACHPADYETARERNDRKWAIIYYTDGQPPLYQEPEGEPGNYRLEVFDNYGDTVFVSPPEGSDVRYETEQQAQRAYKKILSRARHDIYYRRLDELEGEKPYGFELLDRNEEVLATHPGQYPSEQERELAIEAVRHGAKNQEVSYKVTREEEGFRFELLDSEGNPLMRSAIAYPDSEAAETAWKLFAGLGCARSNYRMTKKDKPCPYSFELMGPEGEALAVHTDCYENEAERDLALRWVMNYLCYTEFSVEISGEEGSYTFRLLAREEVETEDGLQKRVLFESADTYPDQEKAKQAYSIFLERARERQNYREIDEGEDAFGFELPDEEGAPFATHPGRYETRNERDAAMAMILAYVRNDEVQHQTPNIGGSFYAMIQNNRRELLLAGTELFGTAEEAEARALRIQERGADPDAYLEHQDGKGNCPHGFYIVDEQGAVMARYVRNFQTIEASRQAQMEVLTYLFSYQPLESGDDSPEKAREAEESLNKIRDDVIHANYEYWLPGPEGEEWFRSVDYYPSVEEATGAMEDALALAGDLGHFGTIWYENKHWAVIQDEEEEPLARYSEPFDSNDDAIGAIPALFLHFALLGHPFRLDEAEGEGYYYVLLNREGEDYLRSKSCFPTEREAARALAEAYRLAQLEEQYEKEEGPEPETYSFRLEDEECHAIARYPGTFDGPVQRDEKLDAFVGFLQEDLIAPALRIELVDYYFELRDFSGNVLLRSILNFPESAIDRWLDDILRIADEKSRYRSILQKSGGKCRYSFELLKEEVINNERKTEVVAFHPATYDSISERDAVIDLIILLVARQRVIREIKGTTCGYYYTLELPLSIRTITNGAEGEEEPEAATTEITARLKGQQRYPSPARAARALYELAGLLGQEDSFTEPPPPADRCERMRRPEGLRWDIIDGKSALKARLTSDSEESEAIREAFSEHLQQPVNDWPQGLDAEPARLYCQAEEPGAGGLRGAGIPITLTGRWSGEPFATLWEARNLLNALSGHLTDSNRYPAGADWKFESLNGQPILLEQMQGLDPERGLQVTPFEEDGAWKYTVEIRDYQKTFEEACEHCNAMFELAQEEENYQLVFSNDSCLFGFNLINRTGDLIATHGVFHYSRDACRASMERITQLFNNEGLHLVEHLLLRPTNRGALGQYYFEVAGDEGLPLFRSSTIYREENGYQEALAALRAVLQAIQEEEQSAVFQPLDLGEESGPCRFTFNILADGVPLARPVSDGYPDKSSREKAIQQITGFVSEMEELPGDDALKHWIRNSLTTREMQADGFLPAPGQCTDENGAICPEGADPYSFRITVVLPYWPLRFRRPEFREFINMTIRRETPAHIMPRICWLDVCQMRDFERAYRRWLASRAGDGLECDATEALNALLAELTRLRNEYPDALLHDCDSRDIENSIVLDHTKLG
ncbi:MAG: hypothetical protein H6560_10655 [Lewinellaceae bacterium]|nr:hypothetical protein [Lewinellaceae bacterium]